MRNVLNSSNILFRENQRLFLAKKDVRTCYRKRGKENYALPTHDPEWGRVRCVTGKPGFNSCAQQKFIFVPAVGTDAAGDKFISSMPKTTSRYFTRSHPTLVKENIGTLISEDGDDNIKGIEDKRLEEAFPSTQTKLKVKRRIRCGHIITQESLCHSVCCV